MLTDLEKKRFEIIESANEDLLTQVKKSQEFIFNKIIASLKELTVDNNGKIKPTVSNIKLINKLVKKDVKGIVRNKNYVKSVIKFKSNFKAIANISDEIISEIDAEK